MKNKAYPKTEKVKKTGALSMPGIRLNDLFRSLRSPNYRLYFAGQGVSLIGSWMQGVAMSWLVYRLTKSAFLLGFVGFSSQFPSFILGPFAGVMIDRWNKRRLLMTTQTLFMIQAFLLAILVFMGLIRVWHIIILSVLMGLSNAFDMPLRHAFVVSMVEDRADLGNALALNSMLFNGARFVGPAIAGIVISVSGEGICFLLNAISYLAVIIALYVMKLAHETTEKPKTRIWTELRQGFIYAFGFQPIRSILLLIASISLMGMSFHVLLPIFAKDILKGGANTLGFLMSAIGVGAVAGTVILASRKTVLGLERLIPRAAVIFSCGLVALSLSRTLVLSLGLLCVTGFGMMMTMVSSNTLLQTLVEDSKRGRVMSLYTMAFMGMAPIGSLICGSLAHAIGAPKTVLIGGVFCLAGALVFLKDVPAFTKAAHPVYVEKGILPVVADGIESATDLVSRAEQCAD